MNQELGNISSCLPQTKKYAAKLCVHLLLQVPTSTQDARSVPYQLKEPGAPSKAR